MVAPALRRHAVRNKLRRSTLLLRPCPKTQPKARAFATEHKLSNARGALRVASTLKAQRGTSRRTRTPREVRLMSTRITSASIKSRKITRRSILAGTAAGAVAALSRFPAPAIAQGAPFKLGLLTVKTGPLAEGGIQMEQGVNTYLKQTNSMMGGRKVELVSADTGGNPAGAKTKVQELVERNNVDLILGPLASFELYAINDYIEQQKMPTLSLAAAQDLTQRKPNPYLLRASATSSQAMQPLGDYAEKEMKLKRVVTIVEDFAFGYEQMGGFQEAFEQDGGCVVKKLWTPIVTPDYTPYVAQIANCDGVCQGFAGSNPLRFMKQYHNMGLTYPVVTGETGGDDALLKSFGEEAVGMISACPYTLDLETDGNKRFVSARCCRTTTSSRVSMPPAYMLIAK